MAAPRPKLDRRRRRTRPDDERGGATSDVPVALLPAVMLSAVTWSLSRFVVQPLFGPEEYYVDEIFHVPQARRYCRAEFHEWDPSITTLPGLYLLSTTILVPTMKIYNSILSFIGVMNDNDDHDLCSLGALRAINAVGAPACLYYSYSRCQQLLLCKEGKNTTNLKWSLIIRALSIATFPIIYAPYSMLYYTDTWSTASVFLWYSFHLSHKTSPWLKMAFGGFSVLCRQTNVAWLVFASIIDVCLCAEKCFPSIKQNVSTFSYIQASATELLNCCIFKTKNDTSKLIKFLQRCWHLTYPNVTVIALFILFVIVFNNGHIVVGHQHLHIPRFHPMQLCYFAAFAYAFSLPRLLLPTNLNKTTSNSVSIYLRMISTIFRDIMSNTSKVTFIVLSIIISCLVYFNTIAHPFLLADNRHYTFYVWRLLFGPGKSVILRYLPVPLYTYSLCLIDKELTQSSIVYKLSFWIVTPLLLCAQFLLEPRYFVVPYLMYRLHCDIKNSNYTLSAAIFEFITYQICNFAIMWIFLYRPFISTMDNTGRLDRFTW